MIVRVRGRSMVPTLRPGDVLWVRRPGSFRRGQIVLLRRDEELLIKRIVGLPGETVAVRGGHVQVNGAPLAEPYVPPTAYLEPKPDQTWNVKEGTVVLLGDARDDSLDSRRLGPIGADQIVGTAVCRLWPPAVKRPLILMLLLASATLLHAADSGRPGHPLGAGAVRTVRGSELSGRLLAFAVDNRLTLALGKFEPGHGWFQSTDFYAPPQPGDAFTLYTPMGQIGAVTIQEKHSPLASGTFAGWTAAVSGWDEHSTPFALAVAGAVPLSDGPLEPIPSDDSEPKGIVSKYLKSRGLHVDQPFLTQAFTIPVEGQGREETILVAHSDAGAIPTEQEAAIYAVALLSWNDHGKAKVLALASQVSYKPAGRTREEHERLYGTRDFLRLVAAVDIDGDGWKEIILYRAKDDATQIDVFTFNGRRLKKVLSAYKPNYN
jgi:signal peptidase I